MKITIIGTGYVGLVTGTCLAEVGNDVLCVDVDAHKVAKLQRGESPIYEPGLTELLQSNVNEGRIRFTTSHPLEFSDSLIEAYRDVPQLANFLHLPVQAGSDRILAGMSDRFAAAYSTTGRPSIPPERLLKALLQLDDDHEYLGYLRPGSLQESLLPGWPAHPRLRWVETPRWSMAWRGRWDRLDLYHGPNFKMHTTGRFGGIVTIHDLWLARHPEYSRKLLGQAGSSRRAIATAHRARKVVTVSEFSAREIESLYGIAREHIVVIHNGVSDDFAPLRQAEVRAELSHRWDIPAAGFILFVGGADPRGRPRRDRRGGCRRLSRE